VAPWRVAEFNYSDVTGGQTGGELKGDFNLGSAGAGSGAGIDAYAGADGGDRAGL
jgi:hypothetical protein